jgi:predicted nuclease of restriction endonuclease-like (RecB) superfamily
MEAFMSKRRQTRTTPNAAKRSVTKTTPQSDFDVVLGLIETARTRAVAVVNTTLIDLYWNVGEHISRKVAKDEWGQGTVVELAAYIQRRVPNARGLSAQNLWRMRQFFETYRHEPKLSALLRELPWTHNLLILGKSRRAEEREFYLRLTLSQKWTSRELERQINGALFERVALSPPKLAPLVRELHPDAATVFKDTLTLSQGRRDYCFAGRAISAS